MDIYKRVFILCEIFMCTFGSHNSFINAYHILHPQVIGIFVLIGWLCVFYAGHHISQQLLDKEFD